MASDSKAQQWWNKRMDVVNNVIAHPIKALKNAKSRADKFYATDPNANIWAGVGAFLSPNSSSTGDYWYNKSQPLVDAWSYKSTDRPTGDTGDPGTEDRYGSDKPASDPTPTAPQYAWWQGKQYNWNDPNERNVYADARKQYINSMYDRTYNQSLEDINTSEANLRRERGDWMANYETGLQGLDKSKKGRDFGINSWYSSVAPNIYQSAEGEALKESQGTYDQGITEANRQKESAVNYFDQSQNQIARSRAGLGDINFQRQADLDQVNQMLSDAQATAEANRLSSMGSTGAKYNAYGKNADISSFTNLLNQVYGNPKNPGNNQVGYAQNPNSRLGVAVMNLQNGKASPEDIQLLNEYGIVG